jgi:RNA 3'-terminal phosphate cyclase (ATP)
MIDIDGSRGEGGGQILRTSLALSMLTGKPFAMRNVRANRAKPGLRRQHATAVHAAAKLCNGTVHGGNVDSRYLEFTPGAIDGGDLTIDIGTAGSTTLVVQTLLVSAIHAGVTLRATIIGGTHNPMAPPFEFLDRIYVPHLRAMGADVTLTLERHGFVPEGNGHLTLDVRAGGALRPIEILEAGDIVERHATAVLSRLPTHVADRELGVVRERLGEPLICETVELRAGVPANFLMIDLIRTRSRELITGFGEKGLRAEIVAERASDEASAWLAANVPVGEHLADQLLLPMAVAGGGRFRCAPLSLHATTNIDTIRLFLDVPIRVEPDGDAVIVTVGQSTSV